MRSVTNPPRELSTATRRILLSAGLLTWAAAGCGQPPRHEAVMRFDAELARLLGRAKQPAILALMGEPTARDLIGETEVWTYFYGSSGEQSRSKPEVQLVAPQHDGLILDFDREGTLQRYHVILEGRTSRRERSRDR
jgi:hypothetical protein